MSYEGYEVTNFHIYIYICNVQDHCKHIHLSQRSWLPFVPSLISPSRRLETDPANSFTASSSVDINPSILPCPHERSNNHPNSPPLINPLPHPNLNFKIHPPRAHLNLLPSLTLNLTLILSLVPTLIPPPPPLNPNPNQPLHRLRATRPRPRRGVRARAGILCGGGVD
jgi:hypothetical protein